MKNLSPKKTVVIGASPEESRYSFQAVTQLRRHGHPVVAIGKRPGTIADVEILPTLSLDQKVDTVTLYVNPAHQEDYQDLILKLQPKRVIFNPGTENFDFESRLAKNGIEATQACTLVLLSTNQY
jgi:predicted CoA-binding protein